jgi:glycosyltransferase involved in cell wall biosynthesis
MTSFDDFKDTTWKVFNEWYGTGTEGRQKPFIVACIPAYNEDLSIAKVIVQTQKYVNKIIVCDDGSKDMTAEIAERLGAEVIRHHKNAGYGASLRSLFKATRTMQADVMVTIDADGQHNPQSIPALVEPVLKGEADIVIGSRFIGKGKENIPGYRKSGIKIINKLASGGGHGEITDTQSGLRSYSPHAIETLHLSEFGMGASTEILIKAKEHNLKIKEVPVVVTYDERSSTQNPLSHGIEVVGSTIKHLSLNQPITFYGVPGFILILFGGVFWLWTLEMFATSRAISANVVMIAMSFTFFGLILVTTALILWTVVSLVREKE